MINLCGNLLSFGASRTSFYPSKTLDEMGKIVQEIVSKYKVEPYEEWKNKNSR